MQNVVINIYELQRHGGKFQLKQGEYMFNLEESYNKAMQIMRNTIEDIRAGRQLYMEPVKVWSSQVCKNVTDDFELLAQIHTLKDKNTYMYSHPVDVALISYIIGKWINLDQSKLENLVCAGLLHDIGKSKLKDDILNKDKALAADEIEKLKTHPVVGYKLISSANAFNIQVLQGVLFHHERMDGSGYPLGLKGEKINIYSRIIAVADTYDTIISGKVCKKKDSPLKALEIIQENSMLQLDMAICKIFIDNLIKFFNGRAIRLNNEQIGSIVKINPAAIAKPMVCCENEYYDLSVEKELEIAELL